MRPRWLESRELHVLELESHFECVLAVDLRQIIGRLECGSHLVGRQESIASKGLKAVNAKSRKTTIVVLLRNSLDPEFGRNIAQIGGDWTRARGVQIIQTCASNVD